MAIPTNPADEEMYIADSGIYRQWDAAVKIWRKIPNPDIITPDEIGTGDTTQKIWTGTAGEYDLLTTTSNDILYFIKE